MLNIKFAIKISLFFCITIFFTAFLTHPAEASSLISVSDTVSTSRPSPSTPLSSNLSSSDAVVTVFNNGSRFLASDSARIIRTSTGTVAVNNLIAASQSADLTTVYLSSAAGSSAGAGADVLIAPITAIHKIQFTTANAIPGSGHVLITFPGGSNNTASPAATTFAFNGLTSTNIKTDNITCDTLTISSPTIDCVTNAGVSSSTVVTFLIGCSSNTGATCDTQVPTLINPTKSASAGTSDNWKIQVDTKDASSAILDTATASIGIIESVFVHATVDPSLTFTIGGINNGVAINTGNTTGCTNTETTNTGINSSATDVNLGILANTPTIIDVKVSNIAAQLLSVSTNAAGGYVLTATSSGQLQSPSSGYAIASSTTPTAFPSAGTPWFGLHPCGLDVTTATWTESSDNNCQTVITGSTANECKYAWPTRTTAVTLSQDSSGPVGNSLTAGNGLVSVEYAGSVDASVPAGNYQSIVTYVATPTF